MIYGLPCTCTPGKYEVVTDLDIDDFSRERMDFTLNELKEERDGVSNLLG